MIIISLSLLHYNFHFLGEAVSSVHVHVARPLLLGFDLAAGCDGGHLLVAGLEGRLADLAGDFQLRSLAFDKGDALLVEIRILHLDFHSFRRKTILDCYGRSPFCFGCDFSTGGHSCNFCV